jgi:hypothetical protein
VQERSIRIIIDSGSCNNLASTMLVEKLSLPTRKHSNPYYIQWLNDCGKIKVSRSVRVPFSIGAYSDYVDCDVVPMDACSLLLRTPWQYNTDSLHHGRLNYYSLLFKSQKIIIHPMTPEKIVKDDIARTVKYLKNRNHHHPLLINLKLSSMLLFHLLHVHTLMIFEMLLCHAMHLYALVCLFPLRMHHLWIFRLWLQTFCRSMPMSFAKICHRVSHRFVALSTRSTSFPAPTFQTAPCTVHTRMRQKKFSARCRHCLIRVTFVSLLVLARFLCYLFLRKMVHGVCV